MPEPEDGAPVLAAEEIAAAVPVAEGTPEATLPSPAEAAGADSTGALVRAAARALDEAPVTLIQNEKLRSLAEAVAPELRRVHGETSVGASDNFMEDELTMRRFDTAAQAVSLLLARIEKGEVALDDIDPNTTILSELADKLPTEVKMKNQRENGVFLLIGKLRAGGTAFISILAPGKRGKDHIHKSGRPEKMLFAEAVVHLTEEPLNDTVTTADEKIPVTSVKVNGVRLHSHGTLHRFQPQDRLAAVAYVETASADYKMEATA